jgi:hypothetical protein
VSLRSSLLSSLCPAPLFSLSPPPLPSLSSCRFSSRYAKEKNTAALKAIYPKTEELNAAIKDPRIMR